MSDAEGWLIGRRTVVADDGKIRTPNRRTLCENRRPSCLDILLYATVSLRKKSGRLVDAPGRGVVGPKGKYLL